MQTPIKYCKNTGNKRDTQAGAKKFIETPKYPKYPTITPNREEVKIFNRLQTENQPHIINP